MEALVQMWLLQYGLAFVFLGSFFFGETVILAATFLSVEGYWSLLNVFILSFIGTILSDSVWFFFGNQLITFMRRSSGFERRYAIFYKKEELLTTEQHMLHLLFFKFLYGTRILTIMYVAAKRMPFTRFLFLNFIGTIIWLLVMLFVGSLIWRGVVNLIPTIHAVGYTLAAITILIIIYNACMNIFSKKIEDEGLR